MAKTTYQLGYYRGECFVYRKILITVSSEDKYLHIWLHFRIGEEKAEIIRISEPIKSHWAKEKGLDLRELLSDGPYKEKYRKEMIVWSDSVRQRDPGFFCKASIEKSMCHFRFQLVRHMKFRVF